MKIAFLSCFDSVEVKPQAVWASIAQHKPDVLLLLGDNIYMDYGPFSNKKIIKYSNEKFLEEMHMRYKENWKNDGFKSLMLQVKKKFTTWDDHDFAWNNAEGIGSNKVVVPIEKKRISKALHLQFRHFINTCKVDSIYPDPPSWEEIDSQADMGIEYSEVINDGDTVAVKLILCDSRYYCKAKKLSLLGEAQQAWINSEMESGNELKILCTGSTLSHKKQSWKTHSDYEWLQSNNHRNFIVLSGDIHENRIIEHKNQNKTIFREFISSGAATPKFLGIGKEGLWGLIEIESSNIEELKILLLRNDFIELSYPKT